MFCLWYGVEAIHKSVRYEMIGKSKVYCIRHQTDCQYYNIGECTRALFNRGLKLCVQDRRPLNRVTTKSRKECILAGIAQELKNQEEIKAQNVEILRLLRKQNELII